MTDREKRDLGLAQMRNDLAGTQVQVDSIKKRIADAESAQQADRASDLLRKLADDDKVLSILDAVLRCWCKTNTKTMSGFLDRLDEATSSSPSARIG